MKKKISFVLFIILGIIALYFLITRNNGTIKHKLYDFTITDTLSVSKVSLTSNNQKITLDRKVNGWIVNEHFPARQSLVNLILKSLLHIQVKEPVSKANRAKAVKNLTENSTRVDIYQNNQLTKTFYVGQPLPNANTYMLLEHASTPFFVEIPGFNLSLSALFSAPLKDFKTNKIFQYSYDQIASVIFENHEQPEQSFMLEKRNGQISLFSYPQKQPMDLNNPVAAQNYFAQLQNKSFSRFIEDVSTKQLDSIKNSTPRYTLKIELTDYLQKEIKIFNKPGWGKKDAFGELLATDPDQFILQIDNDELVYAQYLAFDPVFKALNTFTKK